MQRIKQMNWLMAGVGLWVALAPFVLGYHSVATAFWNDLIVGAAIVVLAAASALTANENSIRAKNWITAMLGLWLVVAPFILVYAVVPAALWSDAIAGIAILTLSMWIERELPRAMEHAS